MQLADVEFKSDKDLAVEPIEANDHEQIAAPEAAAQELAVHESPAHEPERGFHAESGQLNEHDLTAAASKTEDQEILPANHHETRSGEGSAEA